MHARFFNFFVLSFLVLCLGFNNLHAQKINAAVPGAVVDKSSLPVKQKRVAELKDSLQFILSYRQIIPDKNDYAELVVENEKTLDLQDVELSDELKNYLLRRPII